MKGSRSDLASKALPIPYVTRAVQEVWIRNTSITCDCLHDIFEAWSLRSVFDRVIDKSCPVARSSEIRVAMPDEETRVEITPDFHKSDGEYNVLNVLSGMILLVLLSTVV